MPYISKKQLARLKEVVRDAKMDNASFAFPGENVSVTGSIRNDGIFTTDEFIKDRTRIWRQSWIIDPIEIILEDIEKGNAR